MLLTKPSVLPEVPYRSVRRWQQRGAKPAGQWSLFTQVTVAKA